MTVRDIAGSVRRMLAAGRRGRAEYAARMLGARSPERLLALLDTTLTGR